jgi:hypothetical protein
MSLRNKLEYIFQGQDYYCIGSTSKPTIGGDYPGADTADGLREIEEKLRLGKAVRTPVAKTIVGEGVKYPGDEVGLIHKCANGDEWKWTFLANTGSQIWGISVSYEVPFTLIPLEELGNRKKQAKYLLTACAGVYPAIDWVGSSGKSLLVNGAIHASVVMKYLRMVGFNDKEKICQLAKDAVADRPGKTHALYESLQTIFPDYKLPRCQDRNVRASLIFFGALNNLFSFPLPYLIDY